MRLKLATMALLPSLMIQGYFLKKNTPRLAEPEGERQGVAGQGKALSLLIVGDSAAAGVGVSHQQEALLGQILQRLSPHYQVSYQLYAHAGDTTKKLIRRLKTQPAQQFDIVISSIGVNDVVKLVPAKEWIAQQQQLYQFIRDHFQPKLIIATGVPPMQNFPALPQPMAWLFGQYAKQMNQKLQTLTTAADFEWVEYDLAQYQNMQLRMAEDGFHPSREIYQLWADMLVDKINQKWRL